jgi:deazaflavin-dependent oxidoreductase (nitroreductase family)
MFASRLLMLTHVGRRSGREYSTVLEVTSTAVNPPTWHVVAARGDRADWFRNLAEHPEATVTVGRHRRLPVVSRVVDRDEAARIYAGYVHHHPLAARFVGRALGVDLLRADPPSSPTGCR